MQASRLLSILMLLQSRGRMSARALADALEASVRTVYRDVDQLSAAGVPVYAERGRQGGFQLRDGWRTQLTGLTTREAQTLFMAGLPGPASELGLGDALASAQLKLLAALPAQWQDDARRVGSRFHLDPIDWYRSAPPADHLRAVADAVWTQHRLRIRYESWTRSALREVDPLGLVLKAGVWYLVAAQRGEPRTFRLSSVQEVAVLDAVFERPVGFALARYWRDATERFERDLQRGEATLRVTALGLKRLRQAGGAVAQAADASAGVPDAKGRRELTIPIESPEQAVRELLRLGPEAELLRPAALRRQLAQTLRATAALYRRG